MLFFKNLKKNKNKNSIITEKNEIISYGDLSKNVDNFSKNIKKRCLVFLLCRNNLETIVGYLGFIQSDCAISLIDEKISNELFKKLVSTYKPDYIFLDKKKINFNEKFSSIYSFMSYILLERKNKIFFK